MSIFNGDSRSAQGSRHSSLGEIERGNDFLAPRRHEASILRYSPLSNSNTNGSLLAYLDVALPSHMIINGLKLMAGPGGGYWIALPSKAQVNRDGSPVTDEKGKQRYQQLVDFANREARDRFRDLVLDALRRAHPEAFEP